MTIIKNSKNESSHPSKLNYGKHNSSMVNSKVRSTMQKERVPAKLATPNDLNEKGRQEIAENINPLVADAFALYVKTKNFHWHMSGSHFRDYHLLFDEQADQIFAMIDILAERVRKLGKTTIRSIGQISRLQNIKDNDEVFVEPEKMLQDLMKDNQVYVAHMRAAHKVCADYNDVSTTSILEVFIDEAERRTWFLFETLQHTSS
jgi:starvation-inducible DNA-binding protein